MARKDIRLERYRYARSLGYSSAEARKYRDYSSKRIEEKVRQDERRLEAQSAAELSEKEQEQLKRIRRHRELERKEPERRGRIETESEKLKNFKMWTRRKSFPTDIQQLISEINDENGYDLYDSYGYRIYYHMYVKDRTPPEAVKMVSEKRDT